MRANYGCLEYCSICSAIKNGDDISALAMIHGYSIMFTQRPKNFILSRSRESAGPILARDDMENYCVLGSHA
jgi:hypothetical protein